MPELHSRGVMCYPEILESNGEYTLTGNPGKERMVYLVRYKCQYTFLDTATSEKLIVPWDARAQHVDPSKAGGSALTYYGRYFLLNFFGIATDDLDPDRFQQEVNPPDYIKSEDWNTFRDAVYTLADSDGCTIPKEELFTGAKQYNLDAFKVGKSAELLKEQLSRVVQMIKDDPKMMITRYAALAGKLASKNEGGEA